MIEIENITSQCYKVLVRCYTYNHGQYIQDALNGFSMQQTNFPFVCLVMDDCSTDGEQEVIKAYLDHECDIAHAKFYEDDTANLIIVSHGTNASCTFAIYLLKRNLYKEKGAKKAYVNPWRELCTYEALCEGDDYWTDPYKLQKQVDFLESHEDYSMCFHRVFVDSCLPQDKERFNHLREGDYSALGIYEKWTVPTCTVVYRLKSYSPPPYNPNIVFGDIYLWLLLAEKGKIYCLNSESSVYRRHPEGISVSTDVQTSIRLYKQYVFFENRFPQFRKLARRDQSNALLGIIYAPYFPGIWKYRFKYMRYHPHLFFTSFFTTTILTYTPLRFLKKKYRNV